MKTQLQKSLWAVLCMAMMSCAWAVPSPLWSDETMALSVEQDADPRSSGGHHANIAHYQEKARTLNLAKDKVWQRLFYVNHEHSRVDYDGFFVHPQGKSDLTLEMNQTIDALLTDTSENSPQCRFPARTAWLVDKLGIKPDELADVACAKFHDWYSKVNPHSMTLIFATDYMGNPGSMFGHTLLRIDPIKQAGKNMDLVAYALNYAAITPVNESSAVYAYKGLTGKYRGEYSLMRYFHKTKEYGDLESRDMWEYELSLTPDEVAFLVKHIWEMQHVRFPYYFMDKNCSYALMGLVDLVRPELNLQDKFTWTVVPIETVKEFRRAGLINKETYRPALETYLRHQEKQHGKAFGKTAHQLTKPDVKPEAVLANKDDVDKAKLLEMAYDDLYLQHANKKTDNDFAQQRLRELLVLRSVLDVAKQRDEPPRAYDPSLGHGDKAVSVSVGQMQGDTALSLGYRVAYHGFDDPHMGYATGQLLFLDTAVMVRDDKVKLHHADFLSVHAINPITTYKRPRSWGTDFGYRQVAVDDKGDFSTTDTHGVGVMSAHTGYAKAFFDERMVCSGYVQGMVQVGKALDDGVRAGVSPKVHCLWRTSDKWQGSLTVNVPFWQDKHVWQTHIDTVISYNLSPQNAIRLTARHEQQSHHDWQKVMLSYQRYH
ncbi:MAG: DUF4105 domain-containing protein [Moraxella sp.]|nr:DUF4105 domain-containing protein [Moraxella sp.]